jgi:hypothetical protein
MGRFPKLRVVKEPFEEALYFLAARKSHRARHRSRLEVVSEFQLHRFLLWPLTGIAGIDFENAIT